MARCKDCIHYNICCLWSTTDLDENESYKYCFGNYKDTADVVPRAEVAREIFEEIERLVDIYLDGELQFTGALEDLKKKYTEANNAT